MILAGDIGGTKTHLALFSVVDETVQLQVEHQFASGDFSSLIEVLEAFWNFTPNVSIDAACFGVAGAVIEGQCRTTNLPWEITTSQLQEYLKISDVRLLNDLEATAYGLLTLREEEFVHLNPMGQTRKGNCAVIAAGTGLGEAMLFWDGSRYHPIASEGGHTDFAPSTPQQDALLKWLRHRYGGHVSFERIVSGMGIFTLYEFLAHSGFAPQPSWMMTLSAGVDRSARIAHGALIDNDPLCIETLRLFVEIYGAEAGNLALKTMSVGGVYIGGGIAPKILSAMMGNGVFMNAFVNKGRFEPLLRNMEVKISINPQTALLGAAHFAVDKFQGD